jgi:outer membrane protein OmpA-like peptidoglycan-associated protein
VHGIVGLTDYSYAGNHATELDVGFKASPAKEWGVGVTAGRGIVSGIGSPDFRVAANLAYTPVCGGPLDSDGDGVPDSVDQCPNEPEDHDCFQDDDGCPDLDNDQDGVPDAKDQCPNEKETVNGYKDDDGCPEKDTDGDGILDEKDKCPLVAENKNGIQDDDGCPELDSDGDGIFDAVDKCPNAAEDKDGFEDDDGCPDPDNDKDGIPDAVDKCPNQPETINGFEDTDGCPDKGEAKVKLEGDKILILDKVYFATGKDVILERSFNLLTQVASTLKAHLEIKKLRVEGHTDSQGNEASNLELSQRRAFSVRRFLSERGIDLARLEAQGFGQVRPVANNATAAGREMNRRVEFVIIDSGD